MNYKLLIMLFSKFLKNTKLKVLFILLVSLINNVKAAESSAQLATINIQKITESCSVFQDIRNQMNDQFKKMSQKFDEKAKVVMNEEIETSKRQSILERNAYNKKVAEINTKKQQIQVELEKDKQRLQKIYFDAISDVNKTMNAEIKEFAVKKAYKAIFEMSTLVYNDLDDDTNPVIELLNKKLPEYKIDFTVNNKNISESNLDHKQNIDKDDTKNHKKESKDYKIDDKK